MAVGWRIYYDDGSTFSSVEGDPSDAPSLGVIVIVYADPDQGPSGVGTITVAGYDYYWHDGQWFGGDIFGLFDYLQRPGLKVVKFGRVIDGATYNAVMARAVGDRDLPEKSGRKTWERA